MSRMLTRIVVACALASGPGAAWADVVVTLEAKGGDGQPITGEVPAGTEVVVDISLSVDGDDVPLPDIRSIQFDFGVTGSALEMGTFVWHVDSAAYGGFMVDALPTPAATSLFQGSGGGLIELSETPLHVATLSVLVSASGTLDAVGATAADRASFAEIDAGFPSVAYSLGEANLAGGTLLLAVMGSGDPDGDADGDGVPNTDDIFPDDPAESVDTDDDGTGNNADTDDDQDGVADAEDDLPLDPTETHDSDADGVGDNGDAIPLDPTETTDTDDNGIGDNADTDDDGDGVDDADDAFPLDASETADSDGDGIGDNADADSGSGDGPTGRGGFCGVAMAPTFAILLCGLTVMRFHRRRARCFNVPW